MESIQGHSPQVIALFLVPGLSTNFCIGGYDVPATVPWIEDPGPHWAEVHIGVA